MNNILESNKRLFDFTGVTKFHEAGYYGKRVKAATGERLSLAVARALGYKAFAPIDGYEGDTGHPTETALAFWQVAPEAELYALPYSVAGQRNRFVEDTIPFVRDNGILTMFTSVSTQQKIDTALIDSALETVPNFFYSMSAGNDGEQGYNRFLDCKYIYGTGAYIIYPDGRVLPATYSSVSDKVDFAAPSAINIPSQDGTWEYKGDGTSFSTPWLAGMCALIQDFFIDKMGRPLTREMMYRFLEDHTVDIGAAGKDGQAGWGAVVLPEPTTIDLTKYGGVNTRIIEETYAWAYPLTERKTTTHLVLHHEGASGSTAQEIHAYHLSLGWSGIGYNYYIRKDGSIYRGRPENTAGGHTEGFNYCSIGICFEGNYETEEMPQAQQDAGKWLVTDIKTRYPDIVGYRHKDLTPTACPGKNFPFEYITQEEIEMRYNTIDEIPDWGKPTIQKLITKGALKGTGEGFDISADMLRMFVINDRLGIYGI